MAPARLPATPLIAPVIAPSLAFQTHQLDLLGNFNLDRGHLPLLDTAAHPDVAAFQLFQFYVGGGERPLKAPANANAESPATIAD
jgi:hypothetical protein